MRATLLFPLLALALISTAGAQNQQASPLNCRNCWAKCRDEIQECRSLSKEDMGQLETMTDAEVADIGDDHELSPLKLCLCTLAAGAPDILQQCEDSCPPEMHDGLRSEANIVGNGVCQVPKPELAKTDTDTDSSTSDEGEDQPESEEGNSADTEEPSSGDGNAPSASSAPSIRWSGALLTVVAAMVSAVAI